MLIEKLIRPFKKISHFILAGVGITLLIQLVLWNESFDSLRLFVIGFTWVIFIFTTQWLGNTYIAYLLEQKFPTIEQPLKRSILGILALVLYSTIAYLIVQSIMLSIYNGALPKDYIQWAIGQAKIILPISFVISFVFTYIGYFNDWRRSELNAQRLETEMLRYKYESLQNQINPHFLFNSFNVLSDLVVDDQQLAVKFIQKLSELYRYVLEVRDKELVPLQEELDFIESYIFLIKTRFENKLDVQLHIEKANGLMIVPMAIQLLVENAIKHNVATSKNILKVDIIQREDSIIVKNNLQLKKSVESSTKKGLENLHQQYSFFTERKVEVEQTEKEFVVKVPLLNGQLIIDN